MPGNYSEYGYDANSPQLYRQVQEDAREEKEIDERAKALRNEKGEEIAKEKLGKEEVSEEEIQEILSSYASNKNEYLVNGAVLTCDKAKRGPVKVRIGNSVEVFKGNNSVSYKYTRLKVKENGQSSNGLYVATVGDTVQGVNIMPFRCNCAMEPDRQWEIDKIRTHINECKIYGTCSQLMNLSDEWDNLPSEISYFTYTDVNASGSEEKEGINMMSMLFCKHGGLITPVTSGQTKEALEDLILIYEAEIGAIVSGKSGELAQAAQFGESVKYNISSYLSKDKFGKSSPNYYIVNHEDAYVDENGLVRIRKISGCESTDDYYCVAMAPGFTTAAEKYCTPAEEGNINFGYKLKVCFQDKDGNSYDMDVIVAEEKNSSDQNDFYPHNNLVEFIVEGSPQDTVTVGGNVSFDKLLGGSDLEITEVYAYKDGAIVTGNYRDGGHWEDR